MGLTLVLAVILYMAIPWLAAGATATSIYVWVAMRRKPLLLKFALIIVPLLLWWPAARILGPSIVAHLTPASEHYTHLFGEPPQGLRNLRSSGDSHGNIRVVWLAFDDSREFLRRRQARFHEAADDESVGDLVRAERPPAWWRGHSCDQAHTFLANPEFVPHAGFGGRDWTGTVIVRCESDRSIYIGARWYDYPGYSRQQ